MNTRIMVVDDDARLRTSLSEWLESRGFVVSASASVAAATDAFETFGPDVVLLDFALGDETAHAFLDVIDGAAAKPAVIVISGEADSEEAFSLASRGVVQFLSKPLAPDRLVEVLDRIGEEDPVLAAQARASVGRLGIHEAEAIVRRTMVEEALDRTDGSRRGAARLLCVSRQALQHMLRRLAE
ncbi:MAG: response regulator [Myxococcota bacterium]